jgi:hypothetical protein
VFHQTRLLCTAGGIAQLSGILIMLPTGMELAAVLVTWRPDVLPQGQKVPGMRRQWVQRKRQPMRLEPQLAGLPGEQMVKVLAQTQALELHRRATSPQVCQQLPNAGMQSDPALIRVHVRSGMPAVELHLSIL